MQDTITINQISYNLEYLLKDCWSRLINGSLSSKNPFHFPTIATVNNGFPEVRTLVLRKVLAAEKTLIFYTDYRSPKLEQIKKNNAVSWLFYDGRASIQLRIKTIASIHHQDDTALMCWNESRLESRKCYLVQPAPSSISAYPTAGLPENFDEANLNEDSIAAGYKNFAVVKNKVVEIDWLLLNRDGHRRAQFIFGENEVKQHWIVP